MRRIIVKLMFHAKRILKDRPQRRSQKSPAASGGGASDETANLPSEIANNIREDEQFSLFETKVIQAAGDPLHKAQFVLWFVDEGLTSGQVHRTLNALNIRVDLPTISRTLKKNYFLPSGQRGKGAPVTYKLTAKADADFEKWLAGEGSVAEAVPKRASRAKRRLAQGSNGQGGTHEWCD